MTEQPSALESAIEKIASTIFFRHHDVVEKKALKAALYAFAHEIQRMSIEP
jgi:hypothetical protein